MKLSDGAPVRHVDIVLVVATAAIGAIGILMVYAATRVRLDQTGGDPQLYLNRQALWVVVGVAAMIGVMATDYRSLAERAATIYVVAVVALGVVLSPVGSSAKGAQRWFSLGSFQLQPSAVAGLVLVVAVAAYCDHQRGEVDVRAVVVASVLALVLTALVALQPDLGSTLVLGSALVTVLMVAGARGLHLGILLALAIGAGVVVGQMGLLKPYQKARLTAFLDQSHQPGTVNYNLEQSKIAIGSGGLVGKGLFRGTQTNLAFVPEQQTDFIFTALAEQLGLVGAVSLLGLYAVVAWRVWRAALVARDGLGRLICVGVLAMIMTQVFVNAGMTMGIMPITGIPLPLVSYGGSSTIVSFAALGLVNSVVMRRFA